jgi:hypothetical protein
MTKKMTGAPAGNSEAIRIFERMEEERQRKAQAKAEANKQKKVTLPRLNFELSYVFGTRGGGLTIASVAQYGLEQKKGAR